MQSRGLHEHVMPIVSSTANHTKQREVQVDGVVSNNHSVLVGVDGLNEH